jgi:hypothetical protein
MFLDIETKDMYRNGLSPTRAVINTAHIIRVVDEPEGPVIYLTGGEPLRAVESYIALMAVMRTNYLVAFKGVD